MAQLKDGTVRNLIKEDIKIIVWFICVIEIN